MRKILFAVVALAAASFGLYQLAASGGEWTTSEPEALHAFELGMDAQRKVYIDEAALHFARAVELDPDFGMARLQLVQMRLRQEEIDRQTAGVELRSIDRRRMNERERFLLDLALLAHDRQYDARRQRIDEYLEDHPEDPFALYFACNAKLESDSPWEEITACYERLLDVEPNWVEAHNRLGYLAMGRGMFDEAEKHFRTYRYIAPDQANPHDSLGELLILRGRYDEARTELREAVTIRPDFCASYWNLLDLATFDGRPDDAQPLVAEATEHCPERYVRALDCRARFWHLFGESRWEELAAAREDSCLPEEPALWWMVHRGAVQIGDLETAEEIERGVEEAAPKAPTLDHLRGVRLLAQGEANAAVIFLEQADDKLGYGTQREGVFKLYNRVILASALARLGRKDAAAEVIAEVDAVNPEIVANLDL